VGSWQKLTDSVRTEKIIIMLTLFHHGTITIMTETIIIEMVYGAKKATNFSQRRTKKTSALQKASFYFRVVRMMDKNIFIWPYFP
jgi:hypothetical protein